MDFSLHAQDVYSDTFTVLAQEWWITFFAWVIFSIRYAQTLPFVFCHSSRQSVPARRAEQKTTILRRQGVTHEIQPLFEIWPLLTTLIFLKKKIKKIIIVPVRLWAICNMNLFCSFMDSSSLSLCFYYFILQCFSYGENSHDLSMLTHNLQCCILQWQDLSQTNRKKAGESNFGKTSLWMSDFLFLLFCHIWFLRKKLMVSWKS